eukprot:g12595.t1
MNPSAPRQSAARQRILETAERLFYAEGVRAVGIDRIIAEADVAKMTLYNHFPSKDDLILAVLEYREKKFDALFEKWMKKHTKAGMDRLEAFFAALKDWFRSSGFRGCMFINSFAELADADHAASQFAAQHKERFHEVLKQIITECAGAKSANATTPAISLLVEGAIVTAVMKQSPKPADVAKEAAPDAAIPRPGLKLRKGHVGIVVTDPQNDFLSPQGVTWGVVGENVTENRTVENIGRLFSLAKKRDIPLFISPHYYFPHDHKWEFEGALERLMHDIKMFDRPAPLDTTGFDGSGADWVEQYKPLINDGETIICSPHKVYGPQSNDLVLQLRKRGIEQVILAGMSANLCVESHLRELLEQGFEVAVVGDATAAAQIPGFDGYEAAITNFRFLASDLWSTGEAIERLAEIA